jgi:hypothetical protein
MTKRYQHKLCACGQPATRRVFNIASCERCYTWDARYREQHLIRHTRNTEPGGLVEHPVWLPHGMEVAT